MNSFVGNNFFERSSALINFWIYFVPRCLISWAEKANLGLAFNSMTFSETRERTRKKAGGDGDSLKNIISARFFSGRTE